MMDGGGQSRYAVKRDRAEACPCRCGVRNSERDPPAEDV